MKKVFFVLIFVFFGLGLFAQVTDAQIRETATVLGVPFEALKQLVDSYGTQNIPSGTISIDSITLVQEYRANVMRADNQYKGKTLSVTGPISGIKQTYSGEYYIVLKGESIYDISVYLQESEIIKLEYLSNSQRITIIGTCDGFTGLDVTLKNSIIQN